MQAGTQIAVSGRARREEQHGVFFFDRVQVENFLKERLRVAELRHEFHPHFFADGVAAASNSWPDGGGQIARLASKLRAQAAHAALHDPRQRSSPPGVKSSDDSLAHVDYQHRNAVRSLNAKQSSRLLRDPAIPSKRSCRGGPLLCSGPMHQTGMDLAQQPQFWRFALT